MAIRFAEILEHERPIAVLQRAIASGRVHHALLFSGPAGVGKRQVALAYAAALNCEQRQTHGEGPDACGRCRSCVKMRAGQHPDLMVVEPDGRYIKIEQVREVLARTRYRPYEGRWRVVVIEAAEWMREEAANALLKTLEEPGGETLFVLLTPEPHRLLATIRSRCQPVRFAGLSPQAVARLVGAVEAPAEVVQSAARLAGGSVGKTLHLLGSPLFAERAEVLDRISRLPGAGVEQVLPMADELAQDKAALEELLEMLMTFYRDAVLTRAGTSDERLVNVDVGGAVSRLAQARPVETLMHDIERIAETRRLLIGNVNARMAMENLLLDLAA